MARRTTAAVGPDDPGGGCGRCRCCPLWGVATAAVDGFDEAPRDLLRAALVGAAAVSLLVILASTWWAAGRPRLNDAEQGQLVAELGRDVGRDAPRRLRRAP